MSLQKDMQNNFGDKTSRDEQMNWRTAKNNPHAADHRGACRTVPKKQKRTRMLLLALALLFIAAGIARGDALAIFRKAVFVCMECIGIG